MAGKAVRVPRVVSAIMHDGDMREADDIHNDQTEYERHQGGQPAANTADLDPCLYRDRILHFHLLNQAIRNYYMKLQTCNFNNSKVGQFEILFGFGPGCAA